MGNNLFSVLLNHGNRQPNTGDTTVRKASSLADVKELQLDYRSRRHVVHGNFGIEDLIKLGRDNYVKCFGDRTFYYHAWPDNLSSVLDKAGFIRHDINERTFLVGRFYRRIYIMSGLDPTGVYTCYDELTTNAHYEACQVVTDEIFCNLMEYLDVVLGRKEARIVKLYFGFEDGQLKSYGEIGELYGVNSQRIRQLLRQYQEKLAEAGLPPLKYPGL